MIEVKVEVAAVVPAKSTDDVVFQQPTPPMKKPRSEAAARKNTAFDAAYRLNGLSEPVPEFRASIYSTIFFLKNCSFHKNPFSWGPRRCERFREGRVEPGRTRKSQGEAWGSREGCGELQRTPESSREPWEPWEAPMSHLNCVELN